MRIPYAAHSMRKVLWLSTFILAAPALIVWSLFLLLSANDIPTSTSNSAPEVLSSNTQVLLGSNKSLTEISSDVTVADARPLILRKYLAQRNSELEPHAQLLVDTSDKYGLDFRLLVAIARQESNLCKIIPHNSYNCWGFGIYGTKVTRFDNYPQAIETVSKTLKLQYLDKGLDTPEKIMAKYTPPSVALGGPWAKGVNQFLDELE